MEMDRLAERYRLAALYCQWANDTGGRESAVAHAERLVNDDPENDLDFVVMSVLHGQLEDLTTRSMVRGLRSLGVRTEDMVESVD